MPSTLKFQLPIDSHKVASPRPTKKPRMSLSQTYYIASTARVKLGKEAVKPDHNLRRLVGHANLLDALMVELRDAERQQEAWFNRSVAKAQDEEEKHYQYPDTIAEEDDSDSDIDETEYEMATSVLRSLKSSPVILDSEEIYEDEEDLPELALTRTSSHPPELVHDSDSDDESPPASPPQAVLEYSSSKALPVINLHTGQKPQQQAVVIQTTPLIEAY